MKTSQTNSVPCETLTKHKYNTNTTSVLVVYHRDDLHPPAMSGRNQLTTGLATLHASPNGQGVEGQYAAVRRGRNKPWECTKRSRCRCRDRPSPQCRRCCIFVGRAHLTLKLFLEEDIKAATKHRARALRPPEMIRDVGTVQRNRL